MMERSFVNGRWLYGLEHVKRDLLNRDKQLWIIVDENAKIIACATTRIIVHDLTKVCEIPELAGGDMRSWLYMEPQLATWAKTQGCSELIGFDRGGWARVLGWEKVYTVIRKRLDA